MLSLRSHFSPFVFAKNNQSTLFAVQVCGLKNLKPPPSYDDVVFPEIRRPKQASKVPTLPNNHTPVKMPRTIKLMRWPERVHNNLIYRQFGVQAVYGGRLKFCHFEVLRKVAEQMLNFKKHFFIYRVDNPWQSCTKRPIGFTLGGGKGNIHHFVTPVAPDRMICEIGGYLEWKEAEPILKYICEMMPFKSRPVSQEILIKDKEEERRKKEQNLNPYTYEYVLKNSMVKSRTFAKITHFTHFEKYLRA